jgi:lactoylglutathione lyase
MDYNFDYVRLLVSNYRDSVRFYRDALDMPMIRGDLESGYAEFQAPGIRLALLQRSEMSKALGLEEPSGEGRRHVALAFSVGDVDEAFAELEKKGVRFTLAPRTHSEWNLRTAHLQDPDGNLIEINQRLD